jgi:tetrahydromethanopterin S-methyltransferase subunit G
MVDQPDNMVLIFLRQIDSKLDRLVGDVQDLKSRLTSLDAKVALLHGDFAGQSVRIDRIELRLERIERRLELVPSQPQI